MKCDNLLCDFRDLVRPVVKVRPRAPHPAPLLCTQLILQAAGALMSCLAELGALCPHEQLGPG